MYYLDTPKHRAPWTIARRMSDRLFPQAIPGRHHIVWGVLSGLQVWDGDSWTPVLTAGSR